MAAGKLLLSTSLITRLITLSVGCYFSLGDSQKAQQLLDTIPSLLERKKVGGKDLPTEVFIKKKCPFGALHSTLRILLIVPVMIVAFYKQKQKRRGGAEEKFVEAIKISPSEGKL